VVKQEKSGINPSQVEMESVLWTIVVTVGMSHIEIRIQDEFLLQDID